MLREIVVLSGKGGTGKTSVTAALAALGRRVVLTDCDVDAADLHLVVAPTNTKAQEFQGGLEAHIRPDACGGCGRCAAECRFGALERGAGGRTYRVEPLACEGCGVCARACPRGAVEMRPTVCGQWFRSDTRFGPMLHARLNPGAENSGKLVALLRNEARATAERVGCGLLITDGPPGIGCPVVATLSGADHVLFVTEPTVSGLHDLERVAALTRSFGVPGSVVINRADVNAAQAERIAEFARENKLDNVGAIPYSEEFTRAQLNRRSVVEADGGAAADSLRAIWGRLSAAMSLD